MHYSQADSHEKHRRNPPEAREATDVFLKPVLPSAGATVLHIVGRVLKKHRPVAEIKSETMVRIIAHANVY